MTAEAVTVFEKLAGHLLSAQTRDSQQWNADSGCRGWTNTDILIHLTCTLRELTAPQTLPASVPGDIEATNEVQVAAFRGCTPAAALEDYQAHLRPALDVLEQMQSAERSGETYSLENAGTYPVHSAAESLVFDHFCHLQHDLTVGADTLAPFPQTLRSAALHWSVRWLIAGLPQMSRPELADALTAPVALQLTGASSGGMWTLIPRTSGGDELVTIVPGALAGTTIGSSADDFVRWGTGREQWDKLYVTVRGDTRLAHAVLAAIHVF